MIQPQNSSFGEKFGKINPNVRTAFKSLKTRQKVFVLAGPSGSGKDTLKNALFNDDSLSHRIARTSENFQTRPLRSNESPERTTVVSKSVFNNMYHSNLLNLNQYNNHYYAHSLSGIIKSLKEGKSVVTQLTVEDALALKKLIPNYVKTIFITPPKPELFFLLKRLQKRGQLSLKDTFNRMLRNTKDLFQKHQFDQVIINGKSPQQAAEQIKQYILSNLNQ
jgi:guanylate kinase